MARIIDGTAKNLVGEQVRALRIKRGMSQQALSDKLETMAIYVCRGSVSRIEDRQRTVTDIELYGLSQVLGVPFYAFSHQQGHLAAAAWSAGRLDLLERPFLAWHLSGGTTELLRVEPEEDGVAVRAEILGGTSDISAGQLIDRTGVLLGLPFPAGKEVEKLSRQAQKREYYKVKVNGLTFSLSGMENKVRQMVQRGEEPAEIAWFAQETVCRVVQACTKAAMEEYPGLPVLCSGGVASNGRLKELLRQNCGALFAQPQFSTDNAMGTAVLTWRALERGRAL